MSDTKKQLQPPVGYPTGGEAVQKEEKKTEEKIEGEAETDSRCLGGRLDYRFPMGGPPQGYGYGHMYDRPRPPPRHPMPYEGYDDYESGGRVNYATRVEVGYGVPPVRRRPAYRNDEFVEEDGFEEYDMYDKRPQPEYYKLQWGGYGGRAQPPPRRPQPPPRRPPACPPVAYYRRDEYADYE